ncbi:N-acyl-D-amino-acid deacylase family protein [Pelagerythrobacter rhizovicinus]|uniref:D-aminoacylase n=1 Tax=Pelagerythrobacter rhizovicinus TaxID=2268576 RepID=A0A4Q2KM54_9SPHN|nr:amidohydrolase family protein [Pelagerythrobacter rhizovicinus]RXZ66415.1 D-aminoacylase [Pelagerythrobacter rhizovicinus]
MASRLAAALLAVPSAAAAELPAADLLIVGGEVHDGTGAAGRTADIAVRDDRIVYVGPDGERAVHAARILDASGLLVMPGFIDPHTHADGDLLSSDPDRRENPAYLHQGVTTVVIGNDGGGSPDIAEKAAGLENAGVGTNVGLMVGFGPVREEVLGETNRAPTADELARMQRRVARAICQGALGFSTGLHYAPQTFAETGEIVALTREAGKRGAIYDSHLRDESSYSTGLKASVAEAIAIGREAGAPVHIAHIKALGPDVWGSSGEIIDMVDEARARGQRVTADQYPWRASGTRISNALVPRWALDGGMPGLRARFDDPEAAARLRTEMAENLRRRGGAETLLITRGIGDADRWDGKTLAEVAAAMGSKPIEAAIAILRRSDARVASFNMDRSDIEAFAVQPWVMTGSDGSTGHPRKYATYPKAYRDLVTSGKLDLPTFVRRSSGLVADTLGLTNRGYLEADAFADIVIIDAERFVPRAGYANPEELSEGVVHLIVNGSLAIENGRPTGVHSGRVLLRQPSRGTCP